MAAKEPTAEQVAAFSECQERLRRQAKLSQQIAGMLCLELPASPAERLDEGCKLVYELSRRNAAMDLINQAGRAYDLPAQLIGKYYRAGREELASKTSGR
jgi:hypothetical protein